MKNQFKGFNKVFSFTFLQHIKSKGYKNTTIITAILLFLIPAVVIGYIGGSAQMGEPAYEEDMVYEETEEYEEYVADMSSLKKVVVVYPSGEGAVTMEWLSQYMADFAGYEIEVINGGSDFEKVKEDVEKEPNTLIMVVDSAGKSYDANIIIPDDSQVTEDAAYEFMYQTDMYANTLIEFIDSQKDGEDQGGAVVPESEEEENLEEYTEDDFFKEMMIFVFSYVNVMIIYFFVFAYGQGVANSVIMEKNSKLIETFLVSARPAAIIFGKLLAITSTGILQVLIWLLSLISGTMAGVLFSKMINPEAGLLIDEIMGGIKMIAAGLFSPAGAILALLMLAVGLLLYCSLAAIGGSLASKAEDLSSTNVIFTMVLVVSFMACIFGGALTGETDSSPWLDWIPFTAVMIAPARVLLGAMPLWKTIASFAIILVTTLLSTALAGKVYKSMVLYRGEPMKPTMIIKMLRGK